MTMEPDGPVPDPQEFRLIQARSTISTRAFCIGSQLNFLVSSTDLLFASGV